MIGFVYILVGDHMARGLYKIGSTERSPHARAAELYQHSGVAGRFEVLCFLEVPDYLRVEQGLHRWMSDFRVAENREFFRGGLMHALRWMWFYPLSVGMHACSMGLPGNTGASWPQYLVQLGLLDVEELPSPGWSFDEMRTPWDGDELVDPSPRRGG